MVVSMARRRCSGLALAASGGEAGLLAKALLLRSAAPLAVRICSISTLVPRFSALATWASAFGMYLRVTTTAWTRAGSSPWAWTLSSVMCGEASAKAWLIALRARLVSRVSITMPCRDAARGTHSATMTATRAGVSHAAPVRSTDRKPYRRATPNTETRMATTLVRNSSKAPPAMSQAAVATP